MTDLAGREQVEILADKDPGVGLPGRVYLPGYSRTMGPQSHLFAERERLQSLTWEYFDIKQLSPTIGAELVGLDLSQELTDEVVSEIQQALWDYKVIFFRNQEITSEEQLRFAQRFGELEIHPFLPPNTETLGEKRRLKGQFLELLKYPQLAGTHFSSMQMQHMRA